MDWLIGLFQLVIAFLWKCGALIPHTSIGRTLGRSPRAALLALGAVVEPRPVPVCAGGDGLSWALGMRLARDSSSWWEGALLREPLSVESRAAHMATARGNSPPRLFLPGAFLIS